MQTTIHVSNTGNTADYDKYGNSRGNFPGWKREPWKRSGKHSNRSRSRSRPFSRFVFSFFSQKRFTVGLNGKRSRSGRDFPVLFSTLTPSLRHRLHCTNRRRLWADLHQRTRDGRTKLFCRHWRSSISLLSLFSLCHRCRSRTLLYSDQERERNPTRFVHYVILEF